MAAISLGCSASSNKLADNTVSTTSDNYKETESTKTEQTQTPRSSGID